MVTNKGSLEQASPFTKRGVLDAVVGLVRVMVSFARLKPVGAASAVLLVLLILMCATAPWISPYDPNDTRVGPIFDPPSWANLLGTDSFGRDVLSRIMWGGRMSLVVGISSVLLGTIFGAAVGVVSGYAAGKTDMLVQRGVDALMAFPTLVLALAVVAVLGSSTVNLTLTIAIVVSPLASRVARGSTLSVKEEVYVESARALGATAPRIIRKYILPNIMAPIIVILSVQIGFAILIAASLSFLGLGPPPPAVAWGSMLSDEGREAMENAPWLALFPGLFLSLTILSFNMLGDAVRDVLDPRLRTGPKR